MIGVTLRLDEPITLRPPTPPEPTLRPEDIIGSRPAPLAGPAGLSSSKEFGEDIAMIVHAIAEQYIKVRSAEKCVSLCLRVGLLDPGRVVGAVDVLGMGEL